MLATEFSQEELVFQLANIGGFTAPVKTATSSDTATPGSSRSRKWGGKFQKISRSKNQQLSPSYSTGQKIPDAGPPSVDRSWVSTAHSTPRSLSLSLLEVPFRSTSIPGMETRLNKPVLPRSTSSYDNQQIATSVISPPQCSAKNTPPRVKPFDHPIYTTNKKSYVYEPCSLCLEFISCRASGEKVVSLDCGHLVHEECLMAYFEIPTARDIDNMFPICQKCDNGVRCVPSELELRDKCISQALIKGSPKTRKFRDVGFKAEVHIQEQFGEPLNSSPSGLRKYQFGATRSTSDSKKNVKELSLRLSAFSSKNSIATTARGSIMSGISSIVSSVSNQSPGQVLEDSQNSMCEISRSLPLTVLRSYYSQLLLDNFPQSLRGWELDSKFGPLRIVDRLMFSEDGKTYQDACCYLFTDALLIALVSPTFDPKLPTGMRFDRFLVHHPLSHTSVDSLNSSVLKCTILSAMKNSKIMQGSTFYLTEALDSDKSQVVEKWISALLNKEMVFKSSNFSSTLRTPPVVTHSLSSRLTVIRADTKTVNVDFTEDIEDADIIVRNSVAARDDKSRRTTITSILSLKRDRPKSLAVVLQIDPGRMRDSEFTALINSLRALVTKMKDTKLCLVDPDGGIISQGLAQEQIIKLQNLKRNPLASSRPSFTSQHFKDECCSDMNEKTGIVVFSNTSVELGKSCLFMNYSPFASPNRKMPNELKVHVGYLNVDYTEQVSELIEVSSFHDILETVCYSFNLTFGEDDDDDDDDDDEDEDDSADEWGRYNVSLEETKVADNISVISGQSSKREKSNSGLVDFDAYQDVEQVSPSSPLPHSNGTLCESERSYSSASKRITEDCATPRSAIHSVYLPTQARIGNERLLDDSLDTFKIRRSVIRSLHLESPFNVNEFTSSSPHANLAQNPAIPGWSRFVEGINKALDEAIDYKSSTDNDVRTSKVQSSNYEYL
ncbi:LANO_0C05974g1_1 [Lachancea nothofagi CBS 11611]|uniref:LANO_0C05974g1_1 n=1 Tax=Lachancea nothofagi CBS 11611 TaxID=1266666 RepID=A0A1G4J7W7_9SACH|nr:LANO_0C05974g1_1 [Lachancea nothofagi CBS 11611]